MKLENLLHPLYFDIVPRKFEEGDAYIITSKVNTSQDPKLLIDMVRSSFAQSPFVTKTIEVRELQVRYFETRNKQILKACKLAEKELDKLIDQVKKIAT